MSQPVSSSDNSYGEFLLRHRFVALFILLLATFGVLSVLEMKARKKASDASKEMKEVNTPEKVTSGPANNSDEIAS